MTRRVILDVDTGNDDAIALILAALHPSIDLLACTTVWGNLDVQATTDNTLRVLDFLGRQDVPVYPGLGRRFAPWPFGAHQVEDARPHVRTLPLPSPARQASETSAVEWLVETLRATTEPLTLVPVAPLTNIAAAITVDPRIVDAVEEIVIMGGGHAFGNVSATAEANIWNDAIAADVVLQAGFEHLTLMPLDATHQAMVTREQCIALGRLGTPAGTAASEIFLSYLDVYEDNRKDDSVPPGAPIHDALCVAYLIDPTIVSLREVRVTVETHSARNWGMTVMDLRSYARSVPNARVAFGADRQRFIDLLSSTCGGVVGSQGEAQVTP